LSVVYQCDEGIINSVADFAVVRFDINLTHTPEEGYVAALNREIAPLIVADKIPLGGAPGAFHFFELVYDPARKAADFIVDGAKRLTGYRGHNQYCEGRGLILGAAVHGKSVKRGSGILRSASFEIFS